MQKLVFDFRVRTDIHENINGTKFSLMETVVRTLRCISYLFEYAHNYKMLLYKVIQGCITLLRLPLSRLFAPETLYQNLA